MCQWAGGLINRGACARFVFDTYDAEIERFGGPQGLAESERLFHADSCAAADLVRVLTSREWSAADDRLTLMALTVDDLLRAAGMDDPARLGWYKNQAGKSDRDSGPEYRRLKDGLRAALGDAAAWLASKPFGETIAATLAERGRRVAEVSARLRRLAADGVVDRSLDALCASSVHLHLNRIGGASSEQTLVGLLRRTRESLVKAPVR